MRWLKAWTDKLFATQGETRIEAEPGIAALAADSRPSLAEPVPAVLKFDGKWLRVAGQHFSRPACSANGRWLVGLSDFDGVSRGGCREAGNGCVVLCNLETGRLIHEHRLLARPVDAAVADDGCYIVADKGFGLATQGDLVAFSSKGIELFRKRYQANIFNVGLSSCGRYAAVQTCGSLDADGNLLEVLDIREHSVTLQVRRPKTGWADGYTFDVDDTGQLTLLHIRLKSLGTFRYSASGTFLDDLEFTAAQLERGSFTTKLSVARHLVKENPDNARAEAALGAAEAALLEGAADREDWAVVAHRTRGEALEVLGRYREAVDAYEKALALDDKAGVKRRVTALRKRVQMQGE